MTPPGQDKPSGGGHWPFAGVAFPSFTSCTPSSSHPSWGPTHICGHHGMTEQGQILQEKDLAWFFHQGLEQYSGQAREPGKMSRYEILSQGKGCPLSQA